MPMSKEEALDYMYKARRERLPSEDIINAIWPIPDTPEPAPEYGDWIIWNAKPDSVCPVPEGTMGQVHCLHSASPALHDGDLGKNYYWQDGPSEIIRYRIRQTPAHGEQIVMYVYYGIGPQHWQFAQTRMPHHTHRITLEADATGAPKDGGIQQVEELK